MSFPAGSAPYFEALREYAAKGPARLHVPGHKGGAGADPELLEVLGESALGAKSMYDLARAVSTRLDQLAGTTSGPQVQID